MLIYAKLNTNETSHVEIKEACLILNRATPTENMVLKRGNSHRKYVNTFNYLQQLAGKIFHFLKSLAVYGNHITATPPSTGWENGDQSLD